MPVQQLSDLLLRNRADHLIDDLAVLEQHQRRNATNPEAVGQIPVGVDVDLGHAGLAAVERIAQALEARPGEPLLEIGPGRGALTARLVADAGRLAATEIDRDLAAHLRERFAESELVLFTEDVLALPLERVRNALGAGDRRLVVAGNLPYNISKPIVMKLVREREQVERAVLMFQREVALRLRASRLRSACAAVRCFSANASSSRSTSSRSCSAETCSCRAACFARRRQTLRRNLRAALGDDAAVNRLLDSADLDGSARAESLAPEAFRRLAAVWEASCRDASAR